jgi:hypothetical protein
MIRVLLLWLVLLVATSAYAHKASTSYLQLRVEGGELHGRWDIALRDLDFALGLDSDNDTRLTWGEVRHQQPRIADYALHRLALSADDEPCTLGVQDMLIAQHSDGRYASLVLAGHCQHEPFHLAIGYQLFFDTDALHRGLLNLDFRGSLGGVFAPDQRILHFVVADASRTTVFAQYLRLGLWHVWTGWDHMLFLAGLFLPAILRRHRGQWLPAENLRHTLADTAVMVTMFTLAHALTLSLAATGQFTPSTRWVESGVAGSVMFAGLNNLLPMAYRRLSWLAAMFGLVHGAAMAGALIELGLPPGGRVLALLAFNLGVEAAQLTVLLAVIPWGFAFRRTVWYRWLVLVPGSLLITAVGLIWLVQRLGDIDLGILPV